MWLRGYPAYSVGDNMNKKDEFLLATKDRRIFPEA